MIEEVSVKTNLIITDIHEEYDMHWCGKFSDADPVMQNGLPIFVISGKGGRIELNTCSMKRIEDTAKLLSKPHGRQAVTTDQVDVFLKEVNGNEKKVGYLVHRHVKTYAPMFDKVGYQR